MIPADYESHYQQLHEKASLTLMRGGACTGQANVVAIARPRGRLAAAARFFAAGWGHNMKSSPHFVAHIKDLLDGVPDVRVRAMFGGHGIFREGLIIAILTDDLLYFRADGERGEALRLKGSAQFQPVQRGRAMAMPYYRAPDDALEDPELTTALAADSFVDALAADQAKTPSKRKHRPSTVA